MCEPLPLTAIVLMYCESDDGVCEPLTAIVLMRVRVMMVCVNN